jgi:uncharacterized caspase-like protein
LNEMSADSSLVFFFAGHGQVIKGQYVLHMADSEPSGMGTVPVGFLSGHWQDKAGHGRVLILLDACRSELRRGQRGVASLGASAMRDLAATTAGDMWIETVCGCSEGEVSYEIDELRHGLFTKALLSVLDDPPDSLDSATWVGAAADWMNKWSAGDPMHRRQVAWRTHRASAKEKFVLMEENTRLGCLRAEHDKLQKIDNQRRAAQEEDRRNSEEIGILKRKISQFKGSSLIPVASGRGFGQFRGHDDTREAVWRAVGTGRGVGG